MSKINQLRELLNVTMQSSGRSILTKGVIDSVGGFSSSNVRHLLNNLGAMSRNYYEIGTHLGCSLVSAGYGNYHLKSITGCDNFCQLFGNLGAREECLGNLNRFIPGRYNLLEKDCFTVTKIDLPNPIDLFFSDGSHDFESQRKAITYNAQFLDDECVVVVDDFSYEEPNSGTMQGFKDSGVTIKYCTTLHSGVADDCSERGFWNGLGVFLIHK